MPEDKYAQLLDCSCNMARSAARVITQAFEAQLREAGVKPTQFTILAALANTGPVPLTDLARALTLDRTGLTRNLGVLERHGWVQSASGDADTRQRVISLTDAGYAKLDQAIPYWERAQATAGAMLQPATKANLKTILMTTLTPR